MQNRSSTVRSVNCVLSATTNFYNGVKAHEVRRANGIFVLQPMARKTGRQREEEAKATAECLQLLIPFPLSLSLYLYACRTASVALLLYININIFLPCFLDGSSGKKQHQPFSLSLYVPSVISIRVADEWPPNPLYSSSCPVFSLGCTFLPCNPLEQIIIWGFFFNICFSFRRGTETSCIGDRLHEQTSRVWLDETPCSSFRQRDESVVGRRGRLPSYHAHDRYHCEHLITHTLFFLLIFTL